MTFASRAPLIVPAKDVVFEAAIDVVVAGAGAAGLTAGIAAAEKGAEVWILERDATPAGSTAMSEGAVMAAGTASQRAAGIHDTADSLFADILAKSSGDADPALARAIADHSGPTIDWLAERHHVPLAFDPAWKARYGHSVPRLHKPPSGTGEELVGALVRAAENAGALLVTQALLVGVYADDDHKVRGVAVARPDGSIEPVGCKALVLATCGFGANRQMIAANIPTMAEARYHGHEGNDGSGIAIGRALGGALRHMNAYQGLALLAEPQAIIVHPTIMFAGGIFLNSRGERFINELGDVSGQAETLLKQPGGIAWVVCNQTAMDVGLETIQARQLNELGAFKRADGAAQLAAIIGCDPEAVEASLADVNTAIAQGGADSFGRRHDDVLPLTGPLYAIRVTGALFHTQGGLAVDGAARVLNDQGTPLPNLLAAGGAADSISGNGPSGYLPAAGLCMAVTLGRLAGQSAAQLATA